MDTITPDYNRRFHGSASGTNTYAATLADPAPGAAYTDGQVYTLTFGNGNTGTATLNLNGLGAKAIQFRGAAVTGGEIQPGMTVPLQYDGTAFQIVGVVMDPAQAALLHAALGGI